MKHLPHTLAALAVTGTLVTAGMSGGLDTAAGSTHRPAPVSARPTAARAGFGHPRANAYFPLRPGTVTTLRGSDGGVSLRERVVVTHRTRMIQGVRTRVVRDVLRQSDGTLRENTTDWYAGDDTGRVWYFGEATATYDASGHLESREGTWRAGVHGARAGIVMPAHPGPTDAFRQEFYAHHAEDQAWIVSRTSRVHVPLGTFTHVLRSFEWSRLEPGVMSVKLYARGVGIITEHDIAGGNEIFRVTSQHH